MSPSAAMKMSSPWDKKTFFVSPVWLAKPKNLRLIGGGAGIGGGWCMPASLTSLVPFPLSGSICATDPATKMLLPLPAYLVSSLLLSSFKSSVGSSRGSTTGTTLPEEVRRTPGFAGAEAAAVGASEGDAVGDEVQNKRPSISSATPPNTASRITCFRFSIPSFTYAPDRK